MFRFMIYKEMGQELGMLGFSFSFFIFNLRDFEVIDFDLQERCKVYRGCGED